MTLLGAALLLAAVAVLILRPTRLVVVLAVSAAFPDSAAVSVASNTVSAFHAVAILAMGRAVLLLLRRSSRREAWRGIASVDRGLLLALAVYGFAVTAAGPALFHGLPVFAPRAGIDAQVSAMTPLAYSVSNVAQLAYLLLDLAVIVYLLVEWRVNARVFEVTLTVGAVTALASFLLAKAWPATLFDTMGGYRYGTSGGRIRGTFAEPSILGLFLAGGVAYCVAQILISRGRARLWPSGLLVVLLVDAVLNRSGTLIVAVGATGLIGVLALVARWVYLGPTLRRCSIVAACAAGLGAAACTPVGRAAFDLVTGDKVATASYHNRAAADARGYGILINTDLLGAGLGSNRSSGLLPTMLSTLGIPGTLLLAVLVIGIGLRVARRVPFSPAGWAAIAIAVGQLSSVPDLSLPYLWILLAIALRTAMTSQLNARRVADPARHDDVRRREPVPRAVLLPLDEARLDH